MSDTKSNIELMKEKAASLITPQVLRDNIKRVKEHDKNKDGKFSPDEAFAFFKANTLAPAAVPEMKKMKEAGIQEYRHGCDLLESDIPNKENLKYGLGAIAGIQAVFIEGLKEIAKSIDEEKGKKSESYILPKDLKIDPSVNISPAPEVDPSIKRIKEILREHPDIKRDILKLPDVSELGNLTYEHTCEAVKGHKHKGISM